MLLVQIYNEQGELAFEEEIDTAKVYHLFIKNELEHGKYMARLTVTRASEKIPHEMPALTITDIMIIK